MKYMLDTNICIYVIRRLPPALFDKFNTFFEGDLAVSAITWAELCCGVAKNGMDRFNEVMSFLEIMPFGRTQGVEYGTLTARFPNRKANIDRFIAAHAISLYLPLVTNNAADFSIYRDAGLRVENWVDG